MFYVRQYETQFVWQNLSAICQSTRWMFDCLSHCQSHCIFHWPRFSSHPALSQQQQQSINVNNNYLALVACCTLLQHRFHCHTHTLFLYIFHPTYRFVKHRAPQDFQSFVCPAAGVQFHCHSGPVFSGDAIWRNSARVERKKNTSLVRVFRHDTMTEKT